MVLQFVKKKEKIAFAFLHCRIILPGFPVSKNKPVLHALLLLVSLDYLVQLKRTKIRPLAGTALDPLGDLSLEVVHLIPRNSCVIAASDGFQGKDHVRLV